MSQIAIISGHPGGSGTYCHALVTAYAEGARAGGHEVTVVDLALVRGDPVLRDAGRHQQGIVPAELRHVQDAIAAADHLVFVYPLWLGTMPALLKGVLEQVMTPGFAYGMPGPDKRSWHRGLKGKSARIIVTMGMPALVYRLWFAAHSLKSFRRNILSFCGVGPIRTTLLGGIEMVGDAKRGRWLDDVRRLGEKAV